jgi:hypothetical protein
MQQEPSQTEATKIAQELGWDAACIAVWDREHNRCHVVAAGVDPMAHATALNLKALLEHALRKSQTFEDNQGRRDQEQSREIQDLVKACRRLIALPEPVRGTVAHAVRKAAQSLVAMAT